MLDYWEGKNVDAAEHESQPEFTEVLRKLGTFFDVQEKHGTSVSRLHMHPYGSFLLCYDINKWEDGNEALIKSAMAVPHYSVLEFQLREKHLDNFEVPPIPSKIVLPNGKEIHTSKDSINYNFMLNKKIKCDL